MRIAFLAWESAHAVPIGGVGVHVFALAEALARRGHETRIFTRLGPGQRLHDTVFGVHLHRCPCERKASFVDEAAAWSESLAPYLLDAAGNAPYDWIHCHDWLPLAGALRLQAQGAGRLAFTLHSTEWGRSGAWPDKGESKRIADLERAGATAADLVLFVSEEVRRQAGTLWQVPDWKSAVIPHGVDPARFDGPTPDAAEVKASAGIAPLDPVALFLGALAHRKGPDLLLQAVPAVLARKPDAKFVFLGDGELRTHLEREADRFRVREAVRFLGAPDGAAIVRWIRSCDLVCSPSRTDPSGAAVLSAWAAGKPVIATPAGFPGEAALPGANAWLVEAAPGALAEALGEAFSDFQRLRWMGRNGRVAVETAFAWDGVAERTLEQYRRTREKA